MPFVLMAFVICFWFFFPIPIGNQMRVTLLFWWNAQWDQSRGVEDASRVWGSLRSPAGLVRRVLEFTDCCGLHPGWFAECFGMPEVKITAILWVWHTFPADSTKNMSCCLLSLPCLLLWMKMAEMRCMNYYPLCGFLWIKLIYLLKIHLSFSFSVSSLYNGANPPYLSKLLELWVFNYWFEPPALLAKCRLHTERQKK